jgi:hypothetical protein
MPGVIAARMRSALRGLSTEGRPEAAFSGTSGPGPSAEPNDVAPSLLSWSWFCAPAPESPPRGVEPLRPGSWPGALPLSYGGLCCSPPALLPEAGGGCGPASSTPQQVPLALGETFPRLPGTPLFTVEPLDPLEPLLPYLASPFQCQPDPRGPVRTRKGIGQASNPRLFLSSHERASFWLVLEGDRERSAVRRHGPPAHGGQALHQWLVTKLRGRDSNPRSRAHEAREDSLSSTARRTRDSGTGLAQWRAQGPPICPSPQREIDAKASPVLHVSRSRRRERCCQSHSPALRPWITYQCPTWRGVGARRSHVSEKLRRPA